MATQEHKCLVKFKNTQSQTDGYNHLLATPVLISCGKKKKKKNTLTNHTVFSCSWYETNAKPAGHPVFGPSMRGALLLDTGFGKGQKTTPKNVLWED